MNPRYRPDVLFIQPMEHDHFINAIDEFGPEIVFNLAHDCQLDDLVIISSHLLDHLRAKVGSHDDDRILEIHRSPLTIGHAPIIQNLQQNVEHVGMRLLNLIEQDHGIRLPAHRFGEVTALLIAHVAGRRTDQARDRMLFHEFRHVNADEMVLRIEQEAGQRLA